MYDNLLCLSSSVIAHAERPTINISSRYSSFIIDPQFTIRLLVFDSWYSRIISFGTCPSEQDAKGGGNIEDGELQMVIMATGRDVRENSPEQLERH